MTNDLTQRLKAALEFDVTKAHREICDLAASGARERWRMSIPVRADDSDMLLQEPLDHMARTHALVMAMVECMEALECNTTFHRLGGIDDCEPCKALDRLKLELEKI